MERNFVEVSVPKITEEEGWGKNILAKREFPICCRLNTSKAEIIIFRFTMEDKLYVAEVVDNSYIVLSKRFGYHRKCIAYANG